MIGSIGWMELTIIVVIALLIVGPRGLPKLASSLGRAVRDFKREARELKDAVEFEIDEEERRETSGKKRKKKKPAESSADEKSKTSESESSKA